MRSHGKNGIQRLPLTLWLECSVELANAPFSVVKRPPISRRQLHLMLPRHLKAAGYMEETNNQSPITNYQLLLC
ncbi:MAG: hypothetical protein BRC33_10830 [Cyanobacteria bacterium SW_9_44_58]|nr:MAG: hypothetical protein BRC33_10830 [Cyanobacteria bacterium SW_9_44_58]